MNLGNSYNREWMQRTAIKMMLKIRKISIFKLILRISVCVFIVAASTSKISDADTAYYLASGKYIINYGFYQAGCVFSYVPRPCSTIVHNEWLFHVISYIFYEVGSWNAETFLQIFLAALIFIVLGL